LESIQAELDQIPHNEEWHHKIEQGNKIAAGSHRGIGYDERNEDRYFFREKPDGKTLLVAIDGLGGHLDGE
jgi:serine/threonine protein phosphatase PrpC